MSAPDSNVPDQDAAIEALRSLKELAITTNRSWLRRIGAPATLRDRLGKLREQRNRQFNAPKSAGVDELFSKALGLDRVSDAWNWQGMSVVGCSQEA